MTKSADKDYKTEKRKWVMYTICAIIDAIEELRDNWRDFYNKTYRKDCYATIIPLTDELDIIAQYELNDNWEPVIILNIYNKVTNKENSNTIICHNPNDDNRVTNKIIETQVNILCELVTNNEIIWNDTSVK